MKTKSIKYSFSGHESFPCRSLWLKKGYDFLSKEKNFNAPSAVVDLGVGKNMVAAIRFWLKVFGLSEENKINNIAKYIFDDEIGCDPFVEDEATLWLLHYLLISNNIASIYKLFFLDFHSEKNNFTKDQLSGFIKRKCSENNQLSSYNENTIRKDIGVLFQNYSAPEDNKPNEDLLVLLNSLQLIRKSGTHEDGKTPVYCFNANGKQSFIPEILLYAIIDQKENDKAVSYDILYELSLLFCLTQKELLETILTLENKYSDSLKFTDDGGIKQLLFIREIDKMDVLNNYYRKS